MAKKRGQVFTDQPDEGAVGQARAPIAAEEEQRLGQLVEKRLALLEKRFVSPFAAAAPLPEQTVGNAPRGGQEGQPSCEGGLA
jgi:hypothetical protein